MQKGTEFNGSLREINMMALVVGAGFDHRPLGYEFL